MEIAEEIRALLQEAVELVSIGGSELDLERARSYWYPRILIELGGDHMMSAVGARLPLPVLIAIGLYIEL